MTDGLILEIVIALAGGFGAYAAIRADLARMHERITNTQTRAEQAHERLDRIEYRDPANTWRNNHGNQKT